MALGDLTTLQLVGLAILVAIQVTLLLTAVRSWVTVRESMSEETFEGNKGMMIASIILICAVSIIGPILWFTVMRSQVDGIGDHTASASAPGHDSTSTDIDSLWGKR